MGVNSKISSSAKRVDGEKADKQAQQLAEIEAKQAADREAADKARAEEEKAAREQQLREKEMREAAAKSQRDNVQKIGAAAAAVGSVALGAAVKGAASKKNPIKGTITLVLVIAVLIFLAWLAWPRISAALFPEPEAHTVSALSESAVMRNTAVAFDEVILGEARQKQELIVWEQDVEVESAITQALANIDIFSKTKVIHSFGTGVYTVDMSKVDEAAIAVDADQRTITITIPRAQLQYITKDLEKTEFEDTQHAIFGFGDVKLTEEQQNLLERSIEDAMREQLESEECFADADRAALLVVYDTYQPLIAQVDNSYKLKIVFASTTR